MCDTLVAVDAATAGGATLFAKNSDRHPNEAQLLVRVPAVEHAAGETLRCTYVSIPQARLTHAVILSRPHWMWGAEMGVNEHGVAIGNTAVFTRRVMKRGQALLGMDLLRLGLERAATKDEALEVITGLLERHGQGGETRRSGSLRYDNSFVIADPRGAWALETAGRTWVAERVERTKALSNVLTIRGAGDVRHGVSTGARFAADEGDRFYTFFALGRQRRARSNAFLERSSGALRPPMMMAFLRSHEAPLGRFDPADGVLHADVCRHAGPGPVKIDQTTASMVAELSTDGVKIWVTGTSTPCTGIFKPLRFDTPMPPELGGTEVYDPRSLFWRHERFAREVQRDHPGRSRLFSAERDQLEEDLLDTSPVEAFERADAATQAWHRRVEQSPLPRRRRVYDLAWRRLSREARMP